MIASAIARHCHFQASLEDPLLRLLAHSHANQAKRMRLAFFRNLGDLKTGGNRRKQRVRETRTPNHRNSGSENVEQSIAYRRRVTQN